MMNTMTSRINRPLCAVVLFVTLFLVLPRGTLGIWCFQCNSEHDPECATIQPNETSSRHYRECKMQDYTVRNSSAQFFCRKLVQRIFDRGGMVRVVRRCGWVMHNKLPCYFFANKDHDETVCQCFHDGCNGATGLPKPPVLVPLLASSLSLLYYFSPSKLIF